MHAVGKLGSYITRSVYTVSGPFHPFGGAVDIIVVEQRDGSFKSSPWYVRFGKFQGVLKTKEKVVNISVNGVEADFHMYLDHTGEAYFLREVDGEDEDSSLPLSSSGEDTDWQSGHKRPLKSKSCYYDAYRNNSISEVGTVNGKALTRTSSRRSRILGLVFGRKSIKKDTFQEEEGVGAVRTDSLERAEIAADLLEVKWSTNLPSGRLKKDYDSRSASLESLNGKADKAMHGNDEKNMAGLFSREDAMNSKGHPVLLEETDSLDHEKSNSSHSNLKQTERSIKEIGVEMSCFANECVTGISSLGQSVLEDHYVLNSELLRKTGDLSMAFADTEKHFEAVISEIASPEQLIRECSDFEANPNKKLVKDKVSEEHSVGLPNSGTSEQNETDRIQSLVYFEMSAKTAISSNGLGEKVDAIMDLSCGGCGDVCVRAESLHEMTELTSEIKSGQNGNLDFQRNLRDMNHCNFSNNEKMPGSEETNTNPFTTSIVTETHPQMVSVHPINGSAEGIQSQSLFALSGIEDEKTITDEKNMSGLGSALQPVDDPQQVQGNCLSNNEISIPSSEDSDDEQLLFGDLDDLKVSEYKHVESLSIDHRGRETEPSDTPGSPEIVLEAISLNNESISSPKKLDQEDQHNDADSLTQELRIISGNIDIPKNVGVAHGEAQRMAKSLPNAWSQDNNLDSDDVLQSLGHSIDSIPETSRWTFFRKDASSCLYKSDEDSGQSLSQAQSSPEDAMISEELKTIHHDPAVGDPSDATDASNGSRWKIWPFPRSRSISMKAAQPALDYPTNSDVANAVDDTCSIIGVKDFQKPREHKKKIKKNTPISEQLASLNLKEGRNAVTFTFSTAMLGKQQVDARIYLWRWDSRIVISDVDGTITRSDVLGQFMPMVGVDWSQTGVAHLFSAIKENGYQLLFLSARAISQAYHTRQFLYNLKQDGKCLPDGPVVISPDGLFPSLFREVIRRAPHEFKIACLEGIKALFPSDRNPFYAGFGNRDTDEISYLKVGIPLGKIFIINPKGEVAVSRRVDTKSYTSLHALVHGMFPSMPSFEQEAFNSWNYWKLPPPLIDV